jgi:hypothetical protein
MRNTYTLCEISEAIPIVSELPSANLASEIASHSFVKASSLRCHNEQDDTDNAQITSPIISPSTTAEMRIKKCPHSKKRRYRDYHSVQQPLTSTAPSKTSASNPHKNNRNETASPL